MEIARFEKRIAAYLIDILLALVCGISLGVVFFIYVKMPWYFAFILTIILCYFFYLLIHVPTLTLSKGRTLGALIFGVKTIKNDGTDIHFKDALIKSLYLGLVPSTIVNAIYMLIIHTEITIFDRITDTIEADAKCLR